MRVFEQGHTEFRTNRVWVGGERHEPANYGYGYRNEGNRNDHDRDDRRFWNR